MTGHLKVRCASVPFATPFRVIEPHIEAYVVQAVRMMGAHALTDMAKKTFNRELRVPIEFDAPLAH